MIDPATIVELRVYPPLAVARLGNADGAEDYIIGPETIGGEPTLPAVAGEPRERAARLLEDFRLPNGQIKRQAVRFRVYAHLTSGTVVEVTAADAEIEWSVAVANLKAGWYEFNTAMDLPGQLTGNAEKRNRKLGGSQKRTRLDIVPVPQSISGRSAGPVAFDDGIFWTSPVYLGELRTDAEGRLLFLGGKGRSGSFRPNAVPLTFANNDGWFDDTCDGPVRATVTFPGHTARAASPAYVAVAPPNYAPGLFGVVTLDDAVREVFIAQTWLTRPTATSFTQDVWPIFDRLTGLQWVNHGFFILHGYGSALDARESSVIARMADAATSNAAWRKRAFELFRDPSLTGPFGKATLPHAFGDGVDTEFTTNPDAAGLLSVTQTQYEHLRRWSAGDFASDWPGTPPKAKDFADLDTEEQIEHLERAPLHDCLGGPFHPAMELTWVMRIPHLWDDAYRLKILEEDEPARQNFGETLTPATCTGLGGPYDGVARGALTRFLGLPWQTDHTSCNSAADYFPSMFLSSPTFWGARAPDQVLANGHFLRAAANAAGQARLPLQSHKHLAHRSDWLRDIRGFDYYARINTMITEWAELGMVLPVAPSADTSPELEALGVRVEQGRSVKGRPIADTEDRKYHLTEDVEALSHPNVPPPGAGAAIPRKVAPIPKRTYRPGEI